MIGLSSPQIWSSLLGRSPSSENEGLRNCPVKRATRMCRVCQPAQRCAPKCMRPGWQKEALGAQMTDLSLPKFDLGRSPQFWEMGGYKIVLLKPSYVKIGQIINNSASHWPIMLKLASVLIGFRGRRIVKIQAINLFVQKYNRDNGQDIEKRYCLR